MTALIDLDSILYKAVYKIVTFSQIREAIYLYGKEKAKEWLKQEVYNEGINRCENELLKIQEYVQSIFFIDINSFELFITTCENNFRKKTSTSYKEKRKKNKYVWLLREHYKYNGAFFSDTLEADDLISIRAKELNINDYIVISIDKDLKQIGGFYWSYQKQKQKDQEGNYIINDYGFYETEFKHKCIEFISEKEASLFFWSQMLIGDSVDNIKGVKGIGKVKANKILNSSKNYFISVARKYIESNQKKDFYISYNLLKLKTV